jgi:hypothetical protein
MDQSDRFESVDADLLVIFEQLRRREPIFHTPEFGSTVAEFGNVMAPGYWEVGASGRRYSREFILRMFEDNPPVNAATEEWETSGFGCRRIGPDTYLMTYTLRQKMRVTRRCTIWQGNAERWQILYHQGTVAVAEQDDVPPSPIE